MRAVLEAGGPQVAGVLAAVEQRMTELAAEHGPVLAQHAQGTISAGGKRLRPLLVALCAGPVVAEGEPTVIRAGVAVELIHAATLVHDDVLDRAELRRGRPTVVSLAGRGVATATGDLLFSRAFAELAAGGSPEAVRTLSRACSELAQGELMQRADTFRAVSRERYLERCRLKTAVLFRASGQLGAQAGDGPREGLGRFGELIGIAFQILDDILDVSGPPERTGKPRGADLLDGTVTLPLILAAGHDPQLARLAPQSVRTAAQAAEVCDRIAATGALERCRALALGLVDEAKAVLTALPAAQRRALELVAEGVVERYA